MIYVKRREYHIIWNVYAIVQKGQLNKNMYAQLLQTVVFVCGGLSLRVSLNC